MSPSLKNLGGRGRGKAPVSLHETLKEFGGGGRERGMKKLQKTNVGWEKKLEIRVGGVIERSVLTGLQRI